MEKNEIINVQFSGLIYSQFLFFFLRNNLKLFFITFLNFKYEWNFLIKLLSWLKILFCEKLLFKKKKSKSNVDIWAAKSFIFPLKLRISFNFSALKKLKQIFFFSISLLAPVNSRNTRKKMCRKVDVESDYLCFFLSFANLYEYITLC